MFSLFNFSKEGTRKGKTKGKISTKCRGIGGWSAR
jgi:hypothetical protein